MTGQSRRNFLCLAIVLSCTINLTFDQVALAKPKSDVGPGNRQPGNGGSNGRALGKLKNEQEASPPAITETPDETENSAPIISGTPDDTVLEESFYEFVPSASDQDGDALAFSVSNKPGWADFDPTSGALYGTPTGVDVGHYSVIQIAVSDGHTAAELAPFSIDVTATALASVTLDWQPPTENTDGTPLTDLAGYRIYYGADPNELDNVIELMNPGLTSYVVEELTPDTWYFAMTSLNSRGSESDFSAQAIGDTL